MDDSASRTVFCGNLSSQVADEILFELFLQAGPLEKVSIPKDRDGRTKGYGFVTFKHEDSVPYAMELMKGITLFGKPINLQNRTGAKADNNSYNDPRNQYHQRSMSMQEDMRPPAGLPNFDPQALNVLMGMAALITGNPMMQHMPQGMMPPPHLRNHQQSRSHHGGDRYHDGNGRDDRRDFYNSSDRQRSRDNDYRGRQRDSDHHNRFRGGGYRDRDRDGDRDRNRDRGRDQVRSRSNHRPYDNRYRRRD